MKLWGLLWDTVRVCFPLALIGPDRGRTPGLSETEFAGRTKEVAESEERLYESLSEMTVRKKAILLMMLLIVTFFGGLFVVAQVNPRLSWVAVLVSAVPTVLLLTLRCRRCGKLVYKQRGYWGGPLLPKRCSQCEFDFSERHLGGGSLPTRAE